MTNVTKKLSLAAVLVAGASLPALAHTGAGHTHGFISGLAHPVGGLDHLLAMVAVGIWSALAFSGRGVWVAPIAFVIAMLAGAGLAFAGVALPAVELGIAASVLVLGLMILARVELPVALGAAVVAAFAAFHGYAHGTEASGGIAAYMSGFALATAGLHVAGIGLGHLLTRVPYAPRVIGASIAAAGAHILTS